MDPQQLHKLRVVDLKEILNKKGLSTSGLKADLVRRLRDAYAEENDKDAESDEMKQEPEILQDDEEMRQKQAEAAMHQLAQQQQIMAEEEKIRLAEEQQRLLAEEQQRLMAEEQQRLLAEEQRRLLEEQQQHALAEQQQKLLIEQQQKQMVEEQQKILAEQQQKFLGEQQHKMLSEQQKIFSERDKEKELFQLQQQALREKEEKLQQPPPPPLPMVTSNPIETHVVSAPTAVVTSLVPSHLPLPVPPPQLGHVLPVSSQQATSNAIHMFAPQMPPPLSSMNIPPPPTILVSSLTARPPPRHLSSNNSVPAPNMSHQIAPPGIHPPTMPTSMQQFTQPPPPAVSVVATTVSNVFPPPPPPLSVTLESKPVQNEVNEIAEKQSESSQKTENQVPAGTNSDQTDEIKLPHVVEKILALKNERAQQLGVDPDSVVEAPVELKESSVRKPSSRALVIIDEDDDVDEEETNLKVKESKGRRRKKKKKQKRPGRFDKPKPAAKEMRESKEQSVDIDVEYVQDVLDPADPLYSSFIHIFEKFKLSDPEKDKMEADMLLEEMKREPKVIDRKKPMDLDDDDDDDDGDEDKTEEEKPKLSKRKLKKLSRMTVAELKQKVIRPELVEMHDVTAKDPVLLLHLKASRNTVPVPRHWCFKRKYLQGKRGIEKPAFELPDFIKRTGIMEMRQALQEKEDQKTMKAKMRERVRPKLGKIDIDYQKLHDAFFKWQTKPKMTIHGDLYYEGKEFETRLKEKKPGDLSDDLRVALGMPTGPNANKCPPPWLIAMQRYGPPPSYPNLKIPGLNAPIPDSCSFGYHAGGWGKPPVDEMGRPLYGDVFGTQNAENQPHIPEEEIDHTLWGELESESSEEEEDEEDEDEEEEEQKGEDDSGLVTPAEGLITPSGFSSIPAGMETPDMIELRKRKIEAEMEGGETPALYTILPEKKSERVGAAMMGSTHIYDYAAAIPAAKVKIPGTASVPPQGIEVALDPSELEMDTAAMAARYEQTMREQQSQLEKEDLSDMVAEHAARQKTKRKKQQQDTGKAPKKYKEFKF